jgi:archaellum component FlaC
VRANARKAAIKQRPMPKPPARRPPIRRAAKATAATAITAEVATQIGRIQDKFERLESQAQMEDIFTAVGNIDSKLTQLPFDLEALRDRGYVHSGLLEDRLEAIDDQWDDVRPRVEKALSEQVDRLDRELDKTERQVNRLGKANVKSVDTAVDRLGSRIAAARRALDGLYDDIENELNKIEFQLSQVEKVLDLITGSPQIRLLEAEGPLLAVTAEWQQDGDDGPEGILFLTDQRILFEQREEVVTKKRFGLFKAESEMVQKLLVEAQVHEIEEISHKEEGGFLGMGKDDIIELVFAATAPLSRARFHLKGQDSEDWAAMINRVQSGEIDGDRSDEYMDELEAANITSASFPAQCPNCFAAVPEQPRGVTSYVCEFCGATIQPEAAES